MKNRSGTDWEALETMQDEDIDYSDIAPLDDSFFANAELRQPAESQTVVTIEVDPAVFAWFDAQEDGWERRMRAALRIYMEAHMEEQLAPAG